MKSSRHLPGAPRSLQQDPTDPPRAARCTRGVSSEHAETPGTSPGRQLLGSDGSNDKPDFFFFLEIGFGVCISPSPLPPPFLRHGPASGFWKNKCGKRERKPELNDRMQAT